MILFFFYGDQILKLFFQRGRFSQHDTLVTYSALIFFSISMVFYAIYNVMNKLIYSLGLIKKLLFLTILVVCLKVILNFLLVDILQQDGLALSTSISYVLFFIFSFYFIHKRIKLEKKNVFINEFSFSIINGLLSLIITKILVEVFIAEAPFIEIIIFLLIFSANILLVNHSLVNLFLRLFNTMKGKKSIGRPGSV